jgi:hypothetical protein
MQDAMDRARFAMLARRMAALCLVAPLAGCASTIASVDGYYRQMAVNYQEAIDKAKEDEVSLDRRAQVLATTGDPGKSQKYRRELEKVRKWEEHCAWEKQRFEKAAGWMESHFSSARQSTAPAPSSDRPGGAIASPPAGDPGAPTVKDTPAG